ncbi:MAG TPA: hypothetical protein VN843_11510 [Anaerolineales bacterium]|nr:hypothetical protein [Anaerolineales bacterium]
MDQLESSENLRGKIFGRLEVLYRNGQELPVKWVCICQCEKIISVSDNHLKTGHTQSCGCISTDRVVEYNTTHGLSHTPEYRSWEGMRKRCNNPNNPKYEIYGGRGIKVCEAWSHDFQAFYDYMGPRPGPEYSIDRYPNNDGDYEPGNCRWATSVQQVCNRSNTVRVPYKGQELTLTEISEQTGVSYRLLQARIFRDGLDPETAASKPKETPDLHEFNGQKGTLNQLAKNQGIGYHTVFARLKNGLTLEEALTKPVRRKSE